MSPAGGSRAPHTFQYVRAAPTGNGFVSGDQFLLVRDDYSENHNTAVIITSTRARGADPGRG